MRRAAALLAFAIASSVSLTSALAAGSSTPSPILNIRPHGGHAVQVTVRSPGDLSPAVISARLGSDWALVTGVHRLGPNRPLHLVFAVDTSSSMGGRPLMSAVAAGEQLLDAAGHGDQVGLVAFSDHAQVAAGLTRNVGSVRQSLDGLTTSRGTALYDGVAAAVSMAGADRHARDVVVVLSDGSDTSSAASLESLTGLVAASGVEVDVVGLAQSPAFDGRPLQQIAAASRGGRFTSTTTPSGLAPIARTLARNDLSNTYTVDVSLPPTQARDLHLSLRGEPEVEVGLPAGASGSDDSFWDEHAITLIGLLGFAAVLSASMLVQQLIGRRPRSLSTRLSQYSAAPGKEQHKRRVAMLADLYDGLEQRFEHRRGWKALEGLCQQAGSSAPPGQVLVQMAAAGVVAGAAGWLLLGPWIGLAGLVAGAAAPVGILRVRARRRAAAFEAQLPELLSVWASALRAGRSFAQALDSLVDEADEPARTEFRRAQRQVRLGVSVEQALDDMSRRLRSDSFELVVLTTDVQRKVGGNVASIFDQVSETVRKRQQFTARVRALTAMGRLSARVLLAMPFAMALLLTVINTDYMRPLWATRAGHILIGIALCMMGVGALVLRRMVKPRAIA